MGSIGYSSGSVTGSKRQHLFQPWSG